VYMTLVA